MLGSRSVYLQALVQHLGFFLSHSPVSHWVGPMLSVLQVLAYLIPITILKGRYAVNLRSHTKEQAQVPVSHGHIRQYQV